MYFCFFGSIHKTETASGNEIKIDLLFKGSSFKAVSLFFKDMFMNNKNDDAPLDRSHYLIYFYRVLLYLSQNERWRKLRTMSNPELAREEIL